MAVDFTHPVLADLYTAWPTSLQDNIAAVASLMEGLDPPGKRIGFKRLSAAGVFERWDGAAWVSQPIVMGAGVTFGSPMIVPGAFLMQTATAGALTVGVNSTTSAATDSAEMRVTSNDVIGRFTAYHSAHNTRPNSVWVNSNSAAARLVLATNNTERVSIHATSGETRVTGSLMVFSDNTNRLAINGSAGLMYFDSMNAASSAWLPKVERATVHDWFAASSGAPTVGMRLDGTGLVVGGNEHYNGSKLAVMPAASPVSFTAANQISIGEAGGNPMYRLQLGYALVAGAWVGSVQGFAGGVGGGLVLNGDGGLVGVGGNPLQALLDVKGSIRAYGSSFFNSGVSGITMGLSGTNSHLVMTTSGAPANSRIYDILGDPSGSLTFRLLNDAATAAGPWMMVTRSGITPSAIQLYAPIGFGGPPGFGHTIDFGAAGGGGSLGGVTNIAGSSDTGAYTIWAGRSVINGAYLQLYAASHPTNPNLLLLGNSNVSRLEIAGSGTVNVVAGAGFLRIGNGITRFESAEIAPASVTTLFSVAHGGPRAPDVFQAFLRCKIAEHGYAVGDEFKIPPTDIGDNTRQLHSTCNASTLFLAYVTGTSASMGLRQNRGIAAYVAITNANWRIFFRAHWL